MPPPCHSISPRKTSPPKKKSTCWVESCSTWSWATLECLFALPTPAKQIHASFGTRRSFVEKGRFHKLTAVSYCAKKSCNLLIFVTFVMFGLLLVVSSCVVFIGNCLWMPNLTWKSVTLVQVGTSKMLTFGNLASLLGWAVSVRLLYTLLG